MIVKMEMDNPDEYSGKKPHTTKEVCGPENHCEWVILGECHKSMVDAKKRWNLRAQREDKLYAATNAAKAAGNHCELCENSGWVPKDDAHRYGRYTALFQPAKGCANPEQKLIEARIEKPSRSNQKLCWNMEDWKKKIAHEMTTYPHDAKKGWVEETVVKEMLQNPNEYIRSVAQSRHRELVAKAALKKAKEKELKAYKPCEEPGCLFKEEYRANWQTQFKNDDWWIAYVSLGNSLSGGGRAPCTTCKNTGKVSRGDEDEETDKVLTVLDEEWCEYCMTPLVDGVCPDQGGPDPNCIPTRRRRRMGALEHLQTLIQDFHHQRS